MSRPSLVGELRRAAAVGPSLARGLWGTLLLAAIGTAAHIVVPILVQRTIDAHVTSAGPVDLGRITAVALGALGVLLVAMVANRFALVRMVRATADGLAELRIATFDHLHRLSVQRLSEERRGNLVSRVTSDVDAVTQFLEWGGVALIVGTAQILLTIAVMVVYDWRLALLVAVGASVYGLVLGRFQRVMRRAHDRLRVRVGESFAAMSEAIVGLPAVRAYGAEDRTMARVDGALEAEFRSSFHAGALGAVMFSSAELFAAALTATVVAVGVTIGVGGGLTAGMVVAFLFLVTLFIEPVQMVVEMMDAAQSAAAGIRRILEVLDTPVEVPDPGADGTPLPERPLDVAVEGVSFAYPGDEAVLHDVTFDVPAGRRTVVVGETGSGKSTLAKLVVRLADVDRGRILVGGVPVDRVPFASLRSRVAFVPQAGFLFDGTVADNVRYGRPGATDDEVRRAFADLRLDDWVRQLPDRLETRVGERGGRMSAGERQLVALVRAWLVDPDLLVLDEATSAVDPALEVRLRDAIERLTEGRTSITIAHRLSTAQAADEVLVLDGGRLVERGRHGELVARGGVYASLWDDWTRTTASA